MKRISTKILINPYTLISLAVSVFYGRLLLGAMLYTGDIFAYQLPEKFIIRESLLSGNLPFMNPYILSGSPMLNNIVVAAFYPLNLLLIIGTPVFGFNLFIFVHLLLAGFAMYLLLAKGMRINRNLSCLGGISYALSGPLWGAIDKGFITSAWLVPLFFMGIIHLFRDRDRSMTTEDSEICNRPFYRSHFIIPVVSLSLLFYCGNFMEAYFALITAGLGIILYSIIFTPNLIFKRVAIYSLVALMGVLIAAPQIFPTYIASKSSYRTGGVKLEEAQHWSLPPIRIMEFFVPFSFGTRAETGFEYGKGGYHPLSKYKRVGDSPWFDSIFFGIPILGGVFLAIISILKVIIKKEALDRQTKISALLFSGALIFFLLAIGKHFPFYRLLYLILPGFHFFRHPEKFMEWVNLFLIALGVYGIEKFCITKGDKGFKNFAKTVYMAAFLLVLFMIPTAFYLFSSSAAIKEISRWQLIMIFLSILTAGFTALAINVFAGKSKSFIFTLIALTAIHLTLISYMTQWTIPEEKYEKTNVWTDSLPNFDKSQWRVFTSETIDYSGYKYIKTDFRTMKLQEYINLHTNAPALKKIRTPEGFDAVAEKAYVDYFNLQKDTAKRLLDMSSVKYIGAGIPLDSKTPPLFKKVSDKKHLRYKGTMILENPDALPRISAYSSYLLAEKGKEKQLIFDDKRNIKETFVIENLPSNFSPGEKCSENPSLKINVDHPGKINIDVIDGPKWIVLRDWCSPGWECTSQEGKILPIVKADGGFMAVYADSSSKEIQFRFIPPGLHSGLMAAAAGIILLFLATFRKQNSNTMEKHS